MRQEDRESLVRNPPCEAGDLRRDARNLVHDDHAGTASPSVDGSLRTGVSELELVEPFECFE